MIRNNFCDPAITDRWKLHDFSDKESSMWQYIWYMFSRTRNIVKYTGLPETVPERSLELQAQISGYTVWVKIDDESIPEEKRGVYALFGTLGGDPDANYMPTKAIIANPYLKWNRTYTIGKDCVVMPNDTMYMGLMPLFVRYASMLAENDCSIYLADINARITSIISGSDDITKESAKQYFRDIKKGKLGIVADNAFIESLKVHPFAHQGTTGTITDLIELQQYLKATWFNDLGLSANYNMKRESINSQEAQIGQESLLPLVDDMLDRRKEAIDKVNAMFGTDIAVSLNSAWEVRHEETVNDDAENGGAEDAE